MAIRMCIGYPHCGTSSIKSIYELKTPYMHNEHVMLNFDWEKIPHYVDEIIVSYRHPVAVYTTSVLFNRAHGLDRPPAIYDYVEDAKIVKAMFGDRFSPIVFEDWIKTSPTHKNPTYCFRSLFLYHLTNKLFYIVAGVDSAYLQQAFQKRKRRNIFHWLYGLNQCPRPNLSDEARKAIKRRLGYDMTHITEELRKLGINADWR